MNISFENLSYKVEKRKLLGKKDVTEILKDINGEFRSCELSAIMGPSGSGKSTMLNILSGYTSNGFKGTIKVNNNEANPNKIRKKSSYIMQENSLHTFLSVHETINFAMNLKVGSRLNFEQRRGKIHHILESLGLLEIVGNRVKDISGGEQKRLSIALELVDDPSIIFLDEPTTGLDSSSSLQCIQLLKKLAEERKTIVCTIHSPSALLFDLLDHIYVIADSSCIYQGSTKKLIPFLNELNLICPQIYTPSDFLLEIATNDYGPQNHRLTDKIKNGLNNEFRKVENYLVEEDLLFNSTQESTEYSTSFYQQFKILLYRNFLTNSRDKTLFLMRLLINIGVGLCFGIMYFGIGNEASFIYDIQRFIVYSTFHPMFLGFNSQLTTLPLELPMMKREHFNRWYSIGAYFLALNIVDIPAQILNNAVFVSITYFMTNQPLETFRYFLFFLVSTLVALTSQGLGLLSGSITDVKHTLIIAAGGIFMFTLFSGFFVLMKDASVWFHWLFYGSFLKHGLDGGFLAIFGYNRAKMECEAEFCYFRWPHVFLKKALGVDTTIEIALSVIIFSLLFFRIVAFLIIKLRLKH